MRVVALVILAGFFSGCKTLVTVEDLQTVFGPGSVDFAVREMALDLNQDGAAERVVIFANTQRGLELPENASAFSELGGVIADGFAVFDGRRPSVPVFYRYKDSGGYQLRVDTNEGQLALVSDSNRDHVQYFWGWQSYSGGWPPSGWVAEYRVWNQTRDSYGPWIDDEKIVVDVGK